MVTTVDTAARAALRAFLDGLGSDAASIAKTLRRLRVKGRRFAGCDCPIARACKPLDLGGVTVVSVSSSYIVLDTNAGRTAFTTPPAIGEFITAFDNSLIPDLIDNS